MYYFNNNQLYNKINYLFKPVFAYLIGMVLCLDK